GAPPLPPGVVIGTGLRYSRTGFVDETEHHISMSPGSGSCSVRRRMSVSFDTALGVLGSFLCVLMVAVLRFVSRSFVLGC
ncbi:hypothetical protein ACUJ8H_39825, partial [Streptomyces sp. EKR5.2]|uniref:hypothetical protein n=1 Tax=Streptomyces sp. EKR5.2 TaxID=3461014 RepID=UPI0040429F7E